MFSHLFGKLLKYFVHWVALLHLKNKHGLALFIRRLKSLVLEWHISFFSSNRRHHQMSNLRINSFKGQKGSVYRIHDVARRSGSIQSLLRSETFPSPVSQRNLRCSVSLFIWGQEVLLTSSWTLYGLYPVSYPKPAFFLGMEGSQNTSPIFPSFTFQPLLWPKSSKHKV